MQSGRDTQINAGRDVNLVSAQTDSKLAGGSSFLDEKITQLTGSLSAGRDVSVSAGRDISAIASQIDAKRDIAMSATENLTLASAADESHFYSKDRHVTEQRDHVGQIATTLTARGNVALSAGKDLTLISSRINAGDEAYLVAGDKLELLAAQDSDYSLYDKKDKGSWGSTNTRKDEITKVTNVGSQITTGGDLTLVSGGDQRYQVAKLESGNNLTLQSGGAITFEGVKDLDKESHEKNDSDLAWTSMSGKGHTDETLRQSQLTAQGNLVIKAVDGLHIDVKQIDQKTVSQAIDAMVQADPQLAWLKEAEKRGDVDWRQVKELHDSFQYSHSGLGQGAMLAIIIIVTVLTAGTGTAAAVGASAGATASGAAVAVGASAATAASVGAAASAAAIASFSAAVAQTAVGAINNKGNLGATFKDVISSDSLKGYVLAGATAGIASQFGFNPTELKFDQASAQSVATKVAADSVAKTAIMGGSLKDNLVESAVGTGISIGGAIGANKIGNATLFENGKLTKVAMHAALGGLMAEAMGGDFRTGALAAGANEAVVDFLADKLLPVGVDRGSVEYQQGVSKLLAASQLIGVLTAAVTGGNASAAAAVAANGTQYNNLDHPSAERLLNELQGCRASGNCSENGIREIIGRYEKLSAERSMAMNACQSRSCVDDIQNSAVDLNTPTGKDLINFLKHSVSYDMPGLLTGNPGSIAVPSQGVDGWGALFTSDKQMAYAKNLAEGWLTPSELAGVDQWVKETSWLDVRFGRQLSLQERATLLTELQMTAGMALLGKSPVSSKVGGSGGKGANLPQRGNGVDSSASPAEEMSPDKIITISRGKYPESAAHIEDAIEAGHPSTLTIDRAGAAARRRESMKGTQPTPDMDRDEYPPAMFKEGGGRLICSAHYFVG
ncbi:DUF637 domain-containing protein [Pseudomonas fluorescens]|uniref:DUF637 domain-containing protein n=1 Tax=Pseudomonas fluorescens TaxID=294 RepID=UPI003CFD53B6